MTWPFGAALPQATLMVPARSTQSRLKMTSADLSAAPASSVIAGVGAPMWSDEPGFDEAVARTGVTGICGSGIIEIIAELYLAGIITQDGVVDGALAARSPRVGLAAGEGSHNLDMAKHLVDHAGIGFLQIDAGRIGGVSVAYDAAQYARARGVTYVNHTFTSHLALAASIAPYAGFEAETICEYPVEPKPLALAITANHLLPDNGGLVRLPEAPGYGMRIDHEALRPYLVDAEIRVRGSVLYRTPELGE